MSRRCLVLVESNTSGSGEIFARTAIRMGLTPVLLAAVPEIYRYVPMEGLQVVQLDTSNQQAVADVCREIGTAFEIAGVTSSSEYYVPTVAWLARELHLPGPDEQPIRKCRDKASQIERLQGAGVPVPGFRCVDSVEDAVAAGQELKWPVVVKPVSGSGSVAVRYCPSAQSGCRARRFLAPRERARTRSSNAAARLGRGLH